MSSVADALRKHAPAIWQTLSIAQQKVLSSIIRCRTGALGGVRYQCNGCGREHWVGRSCGNRHCPACGHEKTQLWIEKQTAKLMPVHHFLVTFTVPREISCVLRGHQREGYRCLFDASSQSIRDVGAATKSLKECQLGFFGVLHTWGRDPAVYHPHVHYVVPGGGVKLDADGQPESWQSTPKNFLFHHDTLVRVYKAKLADELRACELYDSVPASAWDKKFVVDIQAVGHGLATLKYLAPYVHRVALSDKRIVAAEDSSVTYTVRPSKSQSTVTRTVEGEAFAEGFAQHVLPTGFQKIRHYGWMSPNSKIKLDEVRWLAWLFLGWTFWLASGHAPQERPLTATLRCSDCGGELRVVEVTYDPIVCDDDRALGYFDSG
ncbi:IS91 family transposase [Aporhodopirellula aestuarii]|uniref:Transposase n=1 Tax=Aporhodopirellula aestuarii TaxID=2950107 RepID=A0ABT0UDS7_9BACT|nr:transposase [Aporhodopirellula aestuarii]MCM2374620.1 transposase [Aporhodopirellula aestuarii]